MNRALARLVAPPTCVLCGGAGQWLDEPWGLDLCIHCDRAAQRCQGETLPFDAAFCLFRYRHPVDQMITGLKFHGDLAFARVLGTLLAHALRAAGGELPECIVPMPLHRSRHRERGFCQTTEIARHLAPRLRDASGARLRVRADLLHRVRATRAQSGLSAAERSRNLAGAFAVAAGIPLPEHVALLDDVVTTGHTALAAATTLKAAGISKVTLWCCARVAREDGSDITREDHPVGRRRTYPTVDPQPERALVARIRKTLEGTAAPDARTAALVGLADATDSLSAIYSWRERRKLRQRIKAVREADVGSKAARDAIQTVLAAIAAGVVVATAAG